MQWAWETRWVEVIRYVVRRVESWSLDRSGAGVCWGLSGAVKQLGLAREGKKGSMKLDCAYEQWIGAREMYGEIS